MSLDNYIKQTPEQRKNVKKQDLQDMLDNLIANEGNHNGNTVDIKN